MKFTNDSMALKFLGIVTAHLSLTNLLFGVFTPIPVTSIQINLDPYKWTGMITNDLGVGSGVVVKHPKIVLSCAHINFDDDNLNDPWITGNRWHRKWNIGYPPPLSGGIPLRGYFHYVNYEDAVLTHSNKHRWDFAVYYAFEDTANGGHGGSWLEDAGLSALKSSQVKLITGYPSGKYIFDSDEWKMHITGPFSNRFSVDWGYYVVVEGVLTGSGNSGGPVWVSDENGDYFFAGVLITGSDTLSLSGVFAMTQSAWNLVDDAIESIDPDLPPSSPAGVTARAGSIDGEIVLSWNARSGATNYKVYYDEDDDNPPFYPSNNGSPSSGSSVGNTTQATIRGLTPGARYYFAVTATNSAGESSFSSQVSEWTLLSSRVGAPGVVLASEGIYDSRISLWWSSVAGATAYQVYRSFFEDGSGATAVSDWISKTYWFDLGAAPGARYYYSVKARNASSTSDLSITALGYVSVPSKPDLIPYKHSSWNWTNAAPLVVSPKKQTLIDEPIHTGDVFSLAFGIKNLGDADSGAFSVEVRDLSVDEIVFESRFKNGLTANSEFYFSEDWRPSSAGSNVLRLLVDSLDEVTEEDEQNNSFSLVVSVNERTPGTSTAMDQAFAGATELAEGWFYSRWFGTFNSAFDPWFFHVDHRWIYIFPEIWQEKAVYFFDYSSDSWFYTNSLAYPSVYWFPIHKWLFYKVGTNPREYIDPLTGWPVVVEAEFPPTIGR